MCSNLLIIAVNRMSKPKEPLNNSPIIRLISKTREPLGRLWQTLILSQ